MNINIDQFAAANKASVDTLFGLSNQALQGVEQLSTLNLQAVKTLLAESLESSLAALSAKSPEEFLKLQTAALQAAPQKALAYGRQVQEILAPLAAAQRATFDAQVADVQAKFLEAVNGALKDAPGAENLLALAKSAVASATNAYEGVTKASKEVSDAIAANVAKVTETAAKSSRNAVATIDA